MRLWCSPSPLAPPPFLGSWPRMRTAGTAASGTHLARGESAPGSPPCLCTAPRHWSAWTTPAPAAAASPARWGPRQSWTQPLRPRLPAGPSRRMRGQRAAFPTSSLASSSEVHAAWWDNGGKNKQQQWETRLRRTTEGSRKPLQRRPGGKAALRMAGYQRAGPGFPGAAQAPPTASRLPAPATWLPTRGSSAPNAASTILHGGFPCCPQGQQAMGTESQRCRKGAGRASPV